jgi:hypothetical protein
MPSLKFSINEKIFQGKNVHYEFNHILQVRKTTSQYLS